MKTCTAAFRVQGMCCAEEIGALKREVGACPGVINLSFDLLNSKMTAEFDPAQTAVADIAVAVARTGMRAEPWGEEHTVSMPRSLGARHGRAILTGASGALAALAFALHWAATGSWAAAIGHGEGAIPPLSVALYGLSAVAGLWFVAPRAVAAARRLRPDMQLLMTIAVLGAGGLGAWFEAASVAFLFSLALLLESWSIGRARRAVEALLDLSPPVAHVICPHGGDLSDRPVAEVRPGETVLVRPGERLPLDGVVVRGASEVSQAPITGESVPVEKVPGAEVFAGSVNGDGALEVRVTRPADQTLLARITRLVQDAHSRRAPTEQWVDRFARVYTPGMLAMAASLMLVPPALLGGGWGEWFHRGLVVLVIACPCALVISTPVSIVAGLTAAARRGILVKGGLFLEIPARLRACAFDKTGTLTAGAPEVQEIVPLNGHTPRELLERAAALEARSEHTLARAILARARAEGVQPAPARDLQRLPGRGAVGRVGERTYWIGSHRLLHERGLATPEAHAQAERLEDAGHSVVAVGSDDHVCGLLTVADRLRPEAAQVVAALRREGIVHIAVLTGDSARTAAGIAEAIGADLVEADLLPEDKVRTIERLVETHGTVAMIGDGVNDAPALARATVGIAMGAAGSDAAIETADIALVADDLRALPWLVRHSRRTLAVIRQNIAFALGLKVVFLALAMPGWATLWMAIGADMGASLLVIFNGLRLLSPPRRG